MSLPDAAVGWGLSYDAVERRRHRAERALVAWIRDDSVGESGVSAGSKGAGRPRQGRRRSPGAGIAITPEPSTTPRR